MPQSTIADPRETLRGLSRRFDEPEALASGRLRALEAYLQSPLPARVQHLWRYTDPALFALHDTALSGGEEAAAPAGSQSPLALPPPLSEGMASGALLGAAVCEGGGLTLTALSPELAKSGVLLSDLHVALREHPHLVEAHLGRLVGGAVSASGQGKFEALNLALWSGGVLVHVPRNVRVAAPVHLWLSLSSRSSPPSSGQTLVATRILVVLEEGAELTLIDESEGGADGLIVNSVVEIFAGPASRLRHVAVQRLEKSVRYHVAQRVAVGRDANALTAIASLGSRVTKSDFGAHLEGKGANVELVGFLLGEERQHFDHHTVHDHRAGCTYSNLDFKVVLKDQAQSAYTGLIRIEAEAPESEAYQENRNLLLNGGTKAESIPELEILTDAVRCTHGATVGSLDPQHIFYLMCRGLPRPEATRLIVSGFVEPTLSRLPESLSERLRTHVEARIRDL